MGESAKRDVYYITTYNDKSELKLLQMYVYISLMNKNIAINIDLSLFLSLLMKFISKIFIGKIQRNLLI